LIHYWFSVGFLNRHGLNPHANMVVHHLHGPSVGLNSPPCLPPAASYLLHSLAQPAPHAMFVQLSNIFQASDKTDKCSGYCTPITAVKLNLHLPDNEVSLSQSLLSLNSRVRLSHHVRGVQSPTLSTSNLSPQQLPRELLHLANVLLPSCLAPHTP
jgi:hypothetical protein